MQTYFSPFLILIVCFSLVKWEKHSLPNELVVLDKIAPKDSLAPHPDHDKYSIHISNLCFFYEFGSDVVDGRVSCLKFSFKK